MPAPARREDRWITHRIPTEHRKKYTSLPGTGSYKAYEKAHLKRLVDMFLPKFPDLPAEIIPNIVRHWGHVGYY